MIARLEKLFFLLLALCPFAMGAVYAFVNMTGGWARFSERRGFDFYYMPTLGPANYLVALFLCALIFSLAVWMSRFKFVDVPNVRDVIVCAVIVFVLAVMTRLSFLVIFGDGMANTLDPGEAWVRAGGTLTNGVDVRITNWGHYVPWWTCYSLLMKSFISLLGDRFELFMAVQTLFGGLTAVAMLLLAVEVFGSLQIAMFASVLYSLMPSNIVYFTAIGNPEHVAIAFHVLAVWLVARWLMRKLPTWSSLVHCALAGIVVSIGDSFKPFFVNLIVATSIVSFVMIVKSGVRERLACARKVASGIFIMIVVNALTHAGAMMMINRVYGVKPSVCDTIPHTLSTGLHRLGEGQVFLSPTGKTYCQLRDSGSSRDDATRIVLGEVFDDWKSHLQEVPVFLLKKTIWTWHEDCCAFYYYEYNRIRGTKVLSEKTVERIRKYGSAVSLLFYFSIMTAASVFSFKRGLSGTSSSGGVFLCGLVVFGFTMLLLLTESAMRYKCVVMPYIIIFASSALLRLARCLLRPHWRGLMPIRFLVVGAWNFVFGYFVFAVLYWLFSERWTDWLIVVVANVIGITNAFVFHRWITYRSTGVWWREYLRFYVVYGTQALLNVALIYLFVTRLRLNGYAVQFVVSVVLTLLSYWLHKCYSFRCERRNE